MDVLAALKDRGDGADEATERAVRAYLADSKLRPPGWRVPVELESSTAAAEAIEVRIDPEALAAIAAEAARQGVRTETLLGHAVMYTWTAERRPDSPPSENAPEKIPGVSVLDASQERHRVSPEISGG